jgi:Sigma-70, region 4
LPRVFDANRFYALFMVRPRQSVKERSCEGAVSISDMSLRHLRTAIQRQEVSFPAQVPVFACQSRADIQWRLVELYFVQNWSCPDLGQRYGITMERVRQLITQWVRRAAVLGYLQPIPPANMPSMAAAAHADANTAVIALEAQMRVRPAHAAAD